MPEHYRFTLPVKAGDQRQLGELTGAACATLVAEIAERHPGPVVLVAPDMQNALRLHDEIRQFTDNLVSSLADWETLPYDSFSRIRRSSLHACQCCISFRPCSAAC